MALFFTLISPSFGSPISTSSHFKTYHQKDRNSMHNITNPKFPYSSITYAIKKPYKITTKWGEKWNTSGPPCSWTLIALTIFSAAVGEAQRSLVSALFFIISAKGMLLGITLWSWWSDEAERDELCRRWWNGVDLDNAISAYKLLSSVDGYDRWAHVEKRFDSRSSRTKLVIIYYYF